MKAQARARLQKTEIKNGQIHKKLEVHRGYISNGENGKKNPTPATIQKLADALGVSADELLR